MDKHGVNSHEAACFWSPSHKLDSISLNLVILRESLEIRDNQWWCIPSIVMLKTVAVDFEIRTIGMRQFRTVAIRKNFEMGPMIAYNSSRAPNREKRDFKNLDNNSSIVGGERLGFNPFGKIIDVTIISLLPLDDWKRSP
ncbi:hypothetical protein Tco_1312762 [Tanacetum coccineum]